MPVHLRFSDGRWRLSYSSAPLYRFASTSSDSNHFFISITLSFPNCKPIHMFALVDCGATSSCISNAFARRHSLPCRLKDVPVPILAVDGCPIDSGLVTHDVVTQLSVDRHDEIIPLAVVSVPFPVILGLDWLKHHNPRIDWLNPDLELSCCNLSPHKPVLVSHAKGFGLERTTTPSQSLAATAVGLGFGLSGSSLAHSRPSLLTPSNHLASDEDPLPPDIGITDTKSKPTTLFLGHLAQWAGYGPTVIPLLRSRLRRLPNLKPISISCVNAKQFAKLSKTTSVSLICFHPVGSPVYVASMSSPSDIDSKSPSSSSSLSSPGEDHREFIPSKYMPSASSVFSPTEVDSLPPHRPYNISINVEEGKTPPFGPLYCLSLDERKALFEYIDENLKKGFIRRSSSAAASPILFVRRKTGELRLCVDYHGLNSITKKNRYPLPLIDDLLDRTQGCTHFSVVDLKNVFNLICVKEGDKWKPAFRTPLGLYEYLVMPFGLTNAPATFQAFIQD